MRRALLLLALTAGCADDAPPPLPAGALRLPRDGILRAGAVEVSDPARLLAARAAEGPVRVDVETGATVAAVARLLDLAESARLAEIVLGGLAVKLGPRPAVPPGTPKPDAAMEVEDARVTSRPSKAEIRVRLHEVDPQQAPRVREAVAGLVEGTGALVLVVEVRRDAEWSRAAALIGAAASALGDRLARLEIAGSP